jgi:hypothetical protein
LICSFVLLINIIAMSLSVKIRKTTVKSNPKIKGNRKNYGKNSSSGKIQVYNEVTGNYVFRDPITQDLVINRSSQPVAGLRIISSGLDANFEIDKDFAIKSEEALVEIFNEKRREKLAS